MSKESSKSMHDDSVTENNNDVPEAQRGENLRALDAFPTFVGAQQQEDATRTLEAIFSRCPNDAKIIISTSEGYGLESHEFMRNEPGVFQRIAKRFAGFEGLPRVYHRATVLHQTTTLAKGQRGKRQDTYGSATLWADADPALGIPLEEWRDKFLSDLQSFKFPPSMVVDSGRGFHLYWFIPFTKDWERVEKVNRALSIALDTDATYDAARILRTPGTWNDKEGIQVFARILELHPERMYELTQFPWREADKEEQGILEQTYETESPPLGFEQSIKSTSTQLWKRIYSEESAREAGAAPTSARGGIKVDRSRNDFFIAVQLLRKGVPPGQVFYVLSHPTWFSGSKFRQSGYNELYARRTIAKAKTFAGEVELSKAPEIAQRLNDMFVMMHHQLTWWIYSSEQGAFIRGGDQIANGIQALAGNKWTKNLRDNVFAFLKEQHSVPERIPVPDHINVTNGMLYWKAQPVVGVEGQPVLLPQSPIYQSIYQLRAKWDPNVDCTAVDAVVSRIFDDESARIWWMFCGFCLFTEEETSIRCLLAIIGPKRRGKTTLLQCLAEFLGKENVSTVSLGELTGEGNQFTTSKMVGKMLNMDVEAPTEAPGKKLSLLKKLAERQTIAVEKKYEGSEDVALIAKMAFAMNQYPKFGITDEALHDRWVMLEPRDDLQAMYPGVNGAVANQHKVLLSDDRNRSAWLLRSIQGLRDLMKGHGFPNTRVVIEGRNKMRYESDSVYRFWMDETEDAPGIQTPMSRIYTGYQRYCSDSGLKNAVAGRNTFIRDSQQFAVDNIIPSLVIKTMKDPGFSQVTCIGRRRRKKMDSASTDQEPTS